MSTSEHDRSSILGRVRSSAVDAEHPFDLHAPLQAPGPSPFDGLSTEIIEEIFSFVCADVCLPPSDVFPYHAMLLSLVCKTWLDITTAQHSLWTTFTVDSDRLTSGCSSLLEAHLKRSGSFSLEIHVHPGRSEEVILEVLDTLIHYSERWEIIDFFFPLELPFLRKLDAAQDRLPLLRFLCLTGPLTQYPMGTKHSTVFGGRSAPSLRCIVLKGMGVASISTLEFPWHRIHHAVVDNNSFNAIRPTLQRSQSLVALSLDMGSYIEQWISRPAIPLTRFPNLQALSVVSYGSNLGNLICPSLKSLFIFPPIDSHVLKFFDNSSCALVHLVLKTVNGISSHVSMIIRHPCLESLRFLHLQGYLLTEEMLEMLVLDSRNMLPSLETLSMDGAFQWVDRHDFESRIKGLKKVAESRTHVKPLDGFLLEIRTSDTAMDLRRPLRSLFLELDVDFHQWGEWEDMKLRELRLFLISKNVNHSVRPLKRS